MDVKIGFSLLKYGFFFWLVSVIYVSLPFRMTSFERVICETSHNLALPYVIINPMATVDGSLPVCDAEKLLPIEPKPPVIFLGQGEDLETAILTLKAAAHRRDTIVVWKNFTRGFMDNYKKKEFIEQQFNDDMYHFLTNYSNYETKEMSLKTALPDMDKYYLGFSYTLLQNNPKIWQDLNTLLHSYGPELQSIIPVNFSRHHAFLYEGKKYHTGFHQAPVADWFIQISNTKKWTFVEPKYTPYVRIVSGDGMSLNSAWDFIPPKTRVPHIDVYSEAGDLMYFPRHWWHEVENMGDEVGVAFGFRPKTDAISVPLDLMMPWTLKPGEFGHRALFGVATIKAVFDTFSSSNQQDSGVKNRKFTMCRFVTKLREHLPNWSWNKYSPPGTPQCPSSCSSLEIEIPESSVVADFLEKDTEEIREVEIPSSEE